MPKLSEKTIVFLSILFAGSFLSLLWFLNQKNQNTVVNLPPQIFPTVFPTKSIDPTVNWKTHISNDSGYEIKFPKEFEFNACPESGEPCGGDLLVSKSTAGNYLGVGDFSFVLVRQFESKENQSLDTCKSSFGACTGAKHLLSQKNIMVANYPAIMFNLKPTFNANISNVYRISDGSSVMEISVEGNFGPTTQSLVDQILSTFKFTESKDNLTVLQNKLNQYLSANLSFVKNSEGQTINLSDYYNEEFAKYGNKTDLIEKALKDSGFVHDQKLDKTIITTWTSTYKSSTNTCVLNGNEEVLNLICN